MASNPNILFYRNNCQACATVINILRAENMLRYFNCVCIDNKPLSVPSPILVIPSIGKQLVGNEIFIWLKSCKVAKLQQEQINGIQLGVQQALQAQQQAQMRQIQMQQEMRLRRQIQEQQQVEQNKKGGVQINRNNPNGFIGSEMTGLSDTYAFTSVDIAPAHSYQTCNDMDKNCIFTAPEQKNKITESVQPTYITVINSKRAEQEKEIEEIYDNQRKHIDVLKQRYEETDKIIDQIVAKQQNAILTSYDVSGNYR